MLFRKKLRTIIYGKGEQIADYRYELKEILDVLMEINNPYLVIYDDLFLVNNVTLALVGEYFEVSSFFFEN